ncbi:MULTISPECIES: acyl-CoA synthetase [unclassified Microbacterium]|uniref:acyl-CoA synthetase n=1 Tax=unclassified Microbacterium TaxID=2609290 RepID=UPI00301636F1
MNRQADPMAHPRTPPSTAPGSPASAAPGIRIDAIADVERMESVPLAARGLPGSTYEALAAGARIDPPAPALSFFLDVAGLRDPVVWTHEELLSDIHRTANALRRLGVQRDDVVAFVLPNLPETHLVIWGAETAGIAFAVNPLLDGAQIAQLLRAGNASWLVTLAPTPGTDVWERVSAAAAQTDSLRGILTVDLVRYAPEAQRAALAALAATTGPTIGDVEVRGFAEVIATAPHDRLEFPPPTSDDVSSYVCTGGTTGLPKIARRTHGAEVYDAWAVQPFVPDAFHTGAAVFCGLPLFHVNAQLVTGLSPWSRGAHVVLGTAQGYRGEGVLDAFWEIVEQYRIRVFSGVPTVFAALLHRSAGDHDVSSIGYALCGAAPMPEELFRAFQERTGVRVLEAYGLTEGTCASSVNPAARPRIGSIGLRLPYQRMSVGIFDDDDTFLRFAAPDEPGVLLISGPNVFAGYVDPDHERGLWVEADGARWVNTGDMARQDADGYFWLTGRKKEIIIRGGHNIDPKVIEEPFHEHPAVGLAAAVGRPDAHAGEVPVVYVQLVPGAAATPEGLLASVAPRIGERAAQPRAVRIVDQLPITPVGKIFKPALVRREIEDVCRAAAAGLPVTVHSVDVVQDPARGHVAHLHASGDVAALREALAPFAFRIEIHDR